MSTKLVERIKEFNKKREPQRLQLKYQKMHESAFAFLRATCHLFYEDWSGNGQLDDAPLAWICGDLHIENFGVYRSGNRLTYFDINDFDEAILAPCTWDLARFLTSVLLAAETWKIQKQDAMILCDRFLQSYTDALRQGKARRVEPETTVEVVRNLFEQLAQRTQDELLQKRTYFDEQKNQRKLKLDEKHMLPLLKEEQGEALAEFMPKFADQYFVEQQSKSELFQQLDGFQTVTPGFFNLLDAARRISGGGSLGLQRYVLLVEGEGSPNGNSLLDLKQAQPSSLEPYLRKEWKQPHWNSPAGRIVSIQNWVQPFAPALLTATTLGKKSYVLKELQPTSEPTDRVQLDELGRSSHLEELMTLMGRVVAWGELRTSGRQRAAKLDELVDFADSKGWQKPLMKYAQAYSEQVQKDWSKFKQAFDKNMFKAA